MGDQPFSPSHNLTLLAAIAWGLHDAKGRKEFSNFGTDAERRQARVLDSLAYLLVSREANQVIAVGLRLRSDESGLEVLVAENEDPLEATLNHLTYIIRCLREIYAELPVQDKLRITSFYPSDTESSFERKSIRLECAIIKHSRAKLLQRFRKYSRHMHFIETAEDVCGLPAAQRADITNDEERRYLHALQTSEQCSREDVETQVKVIQSYLAISELDEFSDADADDVRILLHRMTAWKEKVQRSNSYRRQWDAYTSCRLEKRLTETTGNGALASQDTPDVAHWLSKVTELREHFIRVVDAVTSPKLAQILLNITDSKQVSNTAPSNRMLSLDQETLRGILDTNVAEEVGRLLEKLRKLYNGAWGGTNEDEIVFDSGPIHCECQILTQLHNRSAAPYIGLSKLSCARCDMYLSVYRNKTSAHVYTRGTHGQVSQWASPFLGDSETAATVEKIIRSKLLNMIWHGWDEYSRAAPDTAQQQTADKALQEALLRLGPSVKSSETESHDEAAEA